MKRNLLVILLILVTFSSPVQALDWAYPFVVWKGHVYEVTEEEVDDPGRKIGQVKRGVNQMTGTYFGDASNMYPKGTAYYQIRDISTDSAIAVEIKEAVFVKAVYQNKAPYHWWDGAILIILIFIICIVIIAVRWKLKQMKD